MAVYADEKVFWICVRGHLAAMCDGGWHVFFDHEMCRDLLGLGLIKKSPDGYLATTERGREAVAADKLI